MNGFVLVSYGLTAIALLGYGVSLAVRLRTAVRDEAPEESDT